MSAADIYIAEPDQSLAEHAIAGDGTETVLFLHGLGGDWTNWKPQLTELSAKRRCISWTMPGYGDSPPLKTLSWSALADSAVRLLDIAEVDAATIVGLSMGGYVAQQIAFDHPKRVERLVLVATSATFGRPGDASFKKEFLATRQAPLDEGKTPADLAPDVVEALLGSKPHRSARKNCERSMSRISPEAYRRALSTLVTWDGRKQLSKIQVPTLCVAGDEDTTAPVASLERLAASIGGARLEVIEKCGHLVNLEQPRAFNRVVSEFLT